MIAMAIAVFPGSFDPPTLGHLDVLERGAALFERVVVGVLQNPAKTPTFSQADRVSVFGEIVENRGLSNVEIREVDGVAVSWYYDFCRECSPRVAEHYCARSPPRQQW